MKPELTPVVLFRLAGGATLDVCYIAELAERWLAIAYLRDPKTCAPMDMAFVPYELVLRVAVSPHPAELRRPGFNTLARSRRHKPYRRSASRPSRAEWPREASRPALTR